MLVFIGVLINVGIWGVEFVDGGTKAELITYGIGAILIDAGFGVEFDYGIGAEFDARIGAVLIDCGIDAAVGQY